MKYIKRITYFAILICALFIKIDNVHADMTDMGYFISAAGEAKGGNGGGSLTMKKPYLGGCHGIKVNLVKVGETTPDWVTFYYVFATGATHNTYYDFLYNHSLNPVYNATTGEPGIYGQIYASNYSSTGAFASNIYKTSDLGWSNFFVSAQTGVNFSASGTKSVLESKREVFYEMLYRLLTNNRQINNAGGVYPNKIKEAINSGTITNASTLETYLNDKTTNAEAINELSAYRIVIEPVYTINIPAVYNRGRETRLFMTSKATAYYMKNVSGSWYKQSTFTQNAFVPDKHGSIGAVGNQDASYDGMQDVNNKYGYIVGGITEGGTLCDPTKSCCYSADGKYNATPPNPPENASTYRCEGTVNDDKTCSEEVKQCSTPLKEGACNDDEVGPFYNYYMFLASMEKNSINSKALTMHTTAENAEFKDKEIFEKLVKDMDPTLNYSLNYIRVLEDASGVVDIDSTNYSDFYSKLKQARNTPNSYFQAGNDYYITHTKWCSVDASGKTTCTDTAKLEKETSYYMNRSIYAKTLDIKKMKNSDSTGYTFDLVRTWDKGLENQTFMSNSPTKDSDKFYHPAEYRIAYCITKKEEPNCDDEVNPATCMSGGTKPIFRESDDLKTCTIKKDNHSGFVAIDQTSDIDQEEEDTSKYCTMACKEDLEIELPGEKETAAGQYFKLDEYTPKINAMRTCVTTEIKYANFDNDLKAIEPDIPKKFNIWHDRYEISEHLNGGQAAAESASADAKNNPTVNTGHNIEAKTCSISSSRIDDYCKNEKNVDENDEEAMETCRNSNETKNYTEPYLLETYTYNGKEYKYVQAGGIYCNDDERSGYGAVKNSSGTWEGLSSEESKSYEERAGKTNLQDIKDNYQPTSPSSTNSSEVGKITGSGNDSCSITNADGSVSGPYSYYWETWEIYSYTPALSSETGVTYGGRTGTYISNTICGDSDPTYAQAVREEFNTQSALASQASYDYYQTLKKYQETINNYNRCFNWIDTTKDYNIYGTFSWNSVGALKPFDQNGRYDTYNYEFEPSVSYWYEDKDGGIFPVTYDYEYKNADDNSHKGNGYVESSGFKTEMAYWTTPNIDEKYTGATSTKGSVPSKGQNSEDRNIITCPPDAAKCTSSDTTATPFYRSTYLKRIESVDYTYHLPRVVSSIPDGRVHLKTDYGGTKPTVELDLDASPVNINTREGTYNYKLTITKLKDDLRARKSSGSVEYNDINTHQSKTASGDNTNPDDDYEERFDNGTAKTEPTLTDGSDYVCNYRVINDIYIPDDPKLNFFYRIIDPANINPTGRQLGYNWVDTRAGTVIDRMSEREDDYQELIDEDNGTFEFTLTPLIMKQIRAYNAKQTNSGGYADWDLECHDYEDKNGNPDSQGYHCYSTFLTCLTSKGDSASPGDGSTCHSIFGSSLNATNYNPEYDLEKLRQNRENLLTKQKALDCSNDNAFLNKACGG